MIPEDQLAAARSACVSYLGVLGAARMLRATALAALVATSLSCMRASAPIHVDEVSGPFTWGAASATHVRHLWFAGQPDDSAIEAARDEGVAIVIDLREPHEHDWNEREAVESLGMQYYNVPIRGNEPFSTAKFSEISALVKENQDEEILIHCSSGNRAAAWFTAHLVEDHDMSFGDALAVGRKVGITKDAIEQRVSDYLGQTRPAP